MITCEQCNEKPIIHIGATLRLKDGVSVSRIIVDCDCSHYSVPIDGENIKLVLEVLGISNYIERQTMSQRMTQEIRCYKCLGLIGYSVDAYVKATCLDCKRGTKKMERD